jgi:hypothetical protein
MAQVVGCPLCQTSPEFKLQSYQKNAIYSNRLLWKYNKKIMDIKMEDTSELFTKPLPICPSAQG